MLKQVLEVHLTLVESSFWGGGEKVQMFNSGNVYFSPEISFKSAEFECIFQVTFPQQEATGLLSKVGEWTGFRPSTEEVSYKIKMNVQRSINSSGDQGAYIFVLGKMDKSRILPSEQLSTFARFVCSQGKEFRASLDGLVRSLQFCPDPREVAGNVVAAIAALSRDESSRAILEKLPLVAAALLGSSCEVLGSKLIDLSTSRDFPSSSLLRCIDEMELKGNFSSLVTKLVRAGVGQLVRHNSLLTRDFVWFEKLAQGQFVEVVCEYAVGVEPETEDRGETIENFQDSLSSVIPAGIVSSFPAIFCSAPRPCKAEVLTALFRKSPRASSLKDMLGRFIKELAFQPFLSFASVLFDVIRNVNFEVDFDWIRAAIREAFLARVAVATMEDCVRLFPENVLDIFLINEEHLKKAFVDSLSRGLQEIVDVALNKLLTTKLVRAFSPNSRFLSQACIDWLNVAQKIAFPSDRMLMQAAGVDKVVKLTLRAVEDFRAACLTVRAIPSVTALETEIVAAGLKILDAVPSHVVVASTKLLYPTIRLSQRFPALYEEIVKRAKHCIEQFMRNEGAEINVIATIDVSIVELDGAQSRAEYELNDFALGLVYCL